MVLLTRMDVQTELQPTPALPAAGPGMAESPSRYHDDDYSVPGDPVHIRSPYSLESLPTSYHFAAAVPATVPDHICGYEMPAYSVLVAVPSRQ